MTGRGLRATILFAVAAAPLLSCASVQKVGGGVKGGVTKAVDTTTAKLKALKEATSSAVANINAADEVAVGQGVSLGIISSYNGLVTDVALTDYVNDVANLVARYGKRKPKTQDGTTYRMNSKRVFVGILDDDSVGAFSLPGGFVYITRGLLENLSSESDLAFVLAHELAHIDQEHNLDALKVEVGGEAFLKELSGGGKDEPTGFNNPKFFGAVVNKLFDIKAKLGLSVEQEREADRIGLESAVAAGYDAHAAERVIDLLSVVPHKTSKTRKILRFGRGYDAPEERKAKLADAIAQAPKGRIGERRFDERGARQLEAAIVAKNMAPAIDSEKAKARPKP